MSQAFLNGFRASSGMGMGNVRYPQMRSADQNNTQSGNPRLAYNMPRMNTGAIASGAQQMPTDQDLYAAQQRGGMGGNTNMAQYMGGRGQASPADFAAQQQALQGMQQQPMMGGMAGNPNMGAAFGQQMPAKPMRVRMPIMQQPGADFPVQQMQAMPVQRAQYARPALASINNQGRRVYAQ